MSQNEHMQIRFELPARLDVLWPLSDFARELLSLVRKDLSRKTSDDILLVLHEAFTNVCLHAYEGEDDGFVVVGLLLAPDRVELRLEDRGKSFDEAQWHPPDLDLPLEGGRGVWLMKQLMNEFIYKASPGQNNVLTLVKYLPAG